MARPNNKMPRMQWKGIYMLEKNILSNTDSKELSFDSDELAALKHYNYDTKQVKLRIIGNHKRLYKFVVNKKGYKIISVHKLVYKFFNGEDSIPMNYQIHHIDFNSLNNVHTNLECLTKEEHQKKSGLYRKGKKYEDFLSDPAKTKNKLHLAMIKRYENPIAYQKMVEHNRKFGIKKKGKQRSEETKLKISTSLTGKKLTPEHCRHNGDSHRGIKMSPEFGENISKRMKGKPSLFKGKTAEERYKHPEITRKRQSESARKRFENPITYQKVVEHCRKLNEMKKANKV